jgi:hypothetical protein
MVTHGNAGRDDEKLIEGKRVSHVVPCMDTILALEAAGQASTYE